jgi:cyclopropane fatty-acyl-phospholipid synthase-like methyltransferase
MGNKYWERFWVDYGERVVGKDAQTQVLRTRNKKPIDSGIWQRTLDTIIKKLELQPNENIIDLCCGNGLISTELASLCQSVTSVEISSHLLDQIDNDKYKNIIKVNRNILELDLPAQKYEKIILYAGIQYFDNQEAIEIFQKVYEWLKPAGIFYVGDIPDQRKLWSFYDNEERERAYFDAIKKGEPIIGNWFQAEFLEKLSRYAGFSCTELIDQNAEMINSFFRFDMRFKKVIRHDK